MQNDLLSRKKTPEWQIRRSEHACRDVLHLKQRPQQRRTAIRANFAGKNLRQKSVRILGQSRDGDIGLP